MLSDQSSEALAKEEAKHLAKVFTSNFDIPFSIFELFSALNRRFFNPPHFFLEVPSQMQYFKEHADYC